MNYYQQNNTVNRYTSIQIVNVSFTQIVVDSNVNNLLTKLRLSFSEFDRLVKLEMPVVEIKRKAIEINSTFDVLMGSTNEVDFDKQYEFSRKIVESCVAVIEKYKKAEKLVEFGFELSNELQSSCNNFFNRGIGQQLDGCFWFDLKYYEWLHKEGFLYEENHRYAGRYSRFHSDENLENFFKDNRAEIIRRMLKEEMGYDNKLIVRNPLSNNVKNTIFEAYKILPLSQWQSI